MLYSNFNVFMMRIIFKNHLENVKECIHKSFLSTLAKCVFIAVLLCNKSVDYNISNS